MSFLLTINNCSDGGIGRHVWFKPKWTVVRESSSLSPSTKRLNELGVLGTIWSLLSWGRESLYPINESSLKILGKVKPMTL